MKREGGKINTRAKKKSSEAVKILARKCDEEAREMLRVDVRLYRLFRGDEGFYYCER